MTNTNTYRLTTNSIDILNVLCYEEDLKLAKNNLFKPQRMDFLIRQIGRENSLRILTMPYSKYVSNIIDNHCVLTASNVPSHLSVTNFESLLKKAQKHLQIFYLRNIYPKESDAIKKEYISLFGDVDTSVLWKTIFSNMEEKVRRSNAGIQGMNQLTKDLSKKLEDILAFSNKNDLMFIIHATTIIDLEVKNSIATIVNRRNYQDIRKKLFNRVHNILRENGIYLKDPTVTVLPDLNTIEQTAILIRKTISSTLKKLIIIEPISLEDEIKPMRELYLKAFSEMNRVYGFEKYPLSIIQNT